VRRHPYREPSYPVEAASARPGLDLEEWVVHGLLTIIGVIGIADGLLGRHSAELVTSAFLAFFAGRYLWREGLQAPLRVARHASPRRPVEHGAPPPPPTEIAPRSCEQKPRLRHG
jgi:hypothetical protein